MNYEKGGGGMRTLAAFAYSGISWFKFPVFLLRDLLWQLFPAKAGGGQFGGRPTQSLDLRR